MFFGNIFIDANEMAVSVGCPSGELRNWGKGCAKYWGENRLTTLAALAATSRSEEREERVTLIEASREGESKDTSRLHSAARALNIARVTRRELGKT